MCAWSCEPDASKQLRVVACVLLAARACNRTRRASPAQDPTAAVAETVRSGSSLVDVVWRPSGLPPGAWPDLMAGPLTSKPLALLVNGNTASASEVLAGGCAAPARQRATPAAPCTAPPLASQLAGPSLAA